MSSTAHRAGRTANADGPVENGWRFAEVPPAAGFAAPDQDTWLLPLGTRFARQAERTPERAALVTDREVVTYQQLDARTNRVARALMERDIPRTSVVPLVMAHGVDKIVAAIGTFKAGLTYVPVDAAYRDEHIAKLVEFVGAHTVLVDAANRERWPGFCSPGTASLDIGDIRGGDARFELEAPTCESDPAELCLTSGSTAEPKAVVRTQAMTSDIVSRTIETLRLGPGDRLLLSRNFWTSNLFAPLCVGACVYPFDLRAAGIGKLRRSLLDQAITVYTGMVTGFRELLGQLDAEDRFDSMRLIVLVGEPMFRDDVTRLDPHFPVSCGLQFYYGSTEHQRIAEMAVDRNHLPADGTLVPLGYPSKGLELELLDESLRPVPDGVTGEIAVLGPLLSPGYWRNPTLTAEKWVPRPGAGDARMYLTGDSRGPRAGRLPAHPWAQGRADQGAWPSRLAIGDRERLARASGASGRRGGAGQGRWRGRLARCLLRRIAG